MAFRKQESTFNPVGSLLVRTFPRLGATLQPANNLLALYIIIIVISYRLIHLKKAGATSVNGTPEVHLTELPAPPVAAATKQARLLVIEDDDSLAGYLKERLEMDGFQVVRSAEGTMSSAAGSMFDLVLLDLNLPGADGVEVLKRVRAKDRTLPILVMTARTQLEDRVNALDLGADDYLAKPFEYSELAARVRALLRRVRPGEAIARFEDVEINRIERTVTRAGRELSLTSREYSLLEYLVTNAGQPLTRSQIMENVWKAAFNPATNVVDVYINYLRNKLDRGFERKLIGTVRGVGYRLGGGAPAPKPAVVHDGSGAMQPIPARQ